ncbi:S-layer homology domain-containing protein [Lysinibacillus sp. LZ02]|uniref:S-layer homology domain-containing protein n=1 Tax=Lysinibacillus sp. LZ02 TaxID=3420668 RepID=UPI003D36955C
MKNSTRNKVFIMLVAMVLTIVQPFFLIGTVNAESVSPSQKITTIKRQGSGEVYENYIVVGRRDAGTASFEGYLKFTLSSTSNYSNAKLRLRAFEGDGGGGPIPNLQIGIGQTDNWTAATPAQSFPTVVPGKTLLFSNPDYSFPDFSKDIELPIGSLLTKANIELDRTNEVTLILSSPNAVGENYVYFDPARVELIDVNSAPANSPPTDLSLSASSVAENQPMHTVVGTLNATDPDAGDTFTYSLVSGTGDTDNGSFNISGNELRTNALFDYEAKNSYSVRIKVTDSANNSYEKSFTINITNVNEAPINLTLGSSSVEENNPANTVVGTLSATDPDAGDTFTYSLVSGSGDTDNGSFNISGNELRTNALFDYEAKNSYSVRIKVTDSANNSYEKSFTINITNVNEAPINLTLGSSSVEENKPANTVVGTLSATDPDAGDTFTYSLVSGSGDTDNGSFNISGNELLTNALFDYETKNSYSVRIRATDSGGLNFEKPFTITIINVNEDPIPTLVSMLPADDATNVPVNTNLTMTFSEAITAVAGKSIRIYKSDNSLVETIAADASNVTVNDSTVTINPTANLAYGTAYYVQIDAGAFEDSAHQAIQGISNTTTWNFTTVAPSANANLSDLVLSNGTLSPAFAAGTTSYTANVANNVTSVNVTPTVADSNATVTVNGTAVVSGQASGNIALNVGANTITIGVTAQDDTIKTYTIIVTRAAPTYTIDTIDNQTLTALTAGYTSGTQETKTLTITNTGTGSLANVAVALSGTDASSFDITQPQVTSLTGTDSTTFTVKAKDGLGAGTYTATVTVSAGNLVPVTFNVTQVVNVPPPTYTINTIGNQTLTALTAGYASGTQETKALTIQNTGTGSLTNVAVALSGTDASSFDITPLQATSLTGTDSTTFTVKVKDGLATGTYTGTLTVSADNLTPVTFTVTQVVNAVPPIPQTYTIDTIDNQTFISLTAGYTSGTQETKTLTIQNTGTGSLANVAVALSGADASSFDITQPQATSLTGTDSATFTVKAKDGLAVGTYTATVTVSADNLTPVTFTVTQVVNPVSVTAPGMPTNVMVTVGNAQATVSFDAPTNNGGSAITGYTVKVYVGGVEQPALAKTGTSSPVTVMGLTNGTAYTFKVIAMNSAGNGVESAESSAVTPTAPVDPGPNPDPGPSTSNTQKIVVDVVDDANPDMVIAQTEITRTTENGHVKDRVNFTPEKALESTQKLAGQEQKVSRIVIPDATGMVGETEVNVSQQAVSTLANGETSLSISTANSKILVPNTSLENWTNDLYFRIVPVKEPVKKETIQADAIQDGQLQQLVTNTATISVLGNPVTIETNMQSHRVTLTLPLPATVTAQQLEQLVVYIQHSDGTTEIKRGKMVEFEPGVRGVEFDVEHFSTFTLLYAPDLKQLETVVKAPYIQGYADGTFRPNANVTRAQMATMLARHLTNNNIPTAARASFTDVENHGAKDAIEFVKTTGLFSGTSETTFNPNGSITRAQMASVIVRWMEQHCTENTTKEYCTSETTGKTFNDVHSTHWAASAIEKVSALGIMSGVSDTAFNPNGFLTRAQAVKVLNRLFEIKPVTTIEKSMFTDVSTSHWAIDEIEAAATEVVQESQK